MSTAPTPELATPAYYQYAATALIYAVEPLTAYCDHAPRPNRHADQLDTLISAVADYVGAAEGLTARERARPDWESIAGRLFARFPYAAPQSPLVARCAAHLAQPHLQARLAQPQAERMALASLNSHYLGRPESL